DPLLARMPLVDVLVPADLERLDALAGERLRRRIDGRIVLRVPSREQRDALRLGKAVERGDLGKARGRRLFEQAVEPGESALAGDVEPGLGRGGDGDGLEPVNVADQLAPVGEATCDPLARAARGGNQLEPRIALNRRHMLVVGDLAVAENRDADRL